MRTPPAFCVQFRRRYATRRSVSRVHPYVGGGMLLFAQCFAIPRLHCRRPVLGAPSAHGGVLPGYSARLRTWAAHRRRGLHHPRGISPLAAGGGILSSMFDCGFCLGGSVHPCSRGSRTYLLAGMRVRICFCLSVGESGMGTSPQSALIRASGGHVDCSSRCSCRCPVCSGSPAIAIITIRDQTRFKLDPFRSEYSSMQILIQFRVACSSLHAGCIIRTGLHAIRGASAYLLLPI